MQTAAYRANRSHVLRDQSNRSGHRCTDIGDGYNTLDLTKRTSMADTDAREMLLPAFAGSKQGWSAGARCRKSGVGCTPRTGGGLNPASAPAVPRTVGLRWAVSVQPAVGPRGRGLAYRRRSGGRTPRPYRVVLTAKSARPHGFALTRRTDCRPLTRQPLAIIGRRGLASGPRRLQVGVSVELLLIEALQGLTFRDRHPTVADRPLAVPG